MDDNYRLIDGERRIKALKMLGFHEIDVRIIQVSNLIQAEYDANEYAKQWTVSERVAIEEELISQRKGNNQYSGKEGKQNFAGTQSEIAAEKAGFNNKETYRQAKNIVEFVLIPIE